MSSYNIYSEYERNKYSYEMNRFLFWDINAQSQKLGFSEFLGKSQKWSILDHFKKSEQNFNSIIGISAKNGHGNVLYWEEKIAFPHKKSHIKAKIDQNYCSPENAI